MWSWNFHGQPLWQALLRQVWIDLCLPEGRRWLEISGYFFISSWILNLVLYHVMLLISCFFKLWLFRYCVSSATYFVVGIVIILSMEVLFGINVLGFHCMFGCISFFLGGLIGLIYCWFWFRLFRQTQICNWKISNNFATESQLKGFLCCGNLYNLVKLRLKCAYISVIIACQVLISRG